MIKTLKIVTDTSCSFTPQEIEKYGIMVIPVIVQIGKELIHENIPYDFLSLAHRISTERILPHVLYPSIDEFFKTYSLVFPKYHHVLSIHMSSHISKLVNQAKNAQALLYDAKIDVLDSPLSENGLKPLIMKAANMALQGDIPRHMILNTLNSFASKYHNYIVSDNQAFVKTNTTYRSGFGLPFSLSSSKKKYIFSATGGDLFLIDHYPNHVIIDKLSRLIEAVSKGSTMYGRILYSLDEEFAKNLAEVLKSRFDFVIKSMEAMSLSSLCRYGAHSTSVGFSFDEDYFAEYCPFEEEIL
jgi:hypothetical protein